MNRAAVCLLLASLPQPSILMLRRRHWAGDPWSGDMAFPGGRADSSDSSILQTALRELEEETGIALTDIDAQHCIRLSDQLTRSHRSYFPMAVTPFVFLLEQRPQVRLNRESATSLWIPLDSFHHNHRQHFPWRFNERLPLRLNMPFYLHGNAKIWGLSLRMIDELISRALTDT